MTADGPRALEDLVRGDNVGPKGETSNRRTLLAAVGVSLVTPFFGSVDTVPVTPPPTPEVSVDVERTGDRLRVVHVGGDRVTSAETDRLALFIDGVPVRRIALPFTVGEALIVEDVDPGTVLTLRWRWRRRRAVLVRFEVERDR